ncbi:MAG: hypothetical protein A3H45_15695 [Ignavibacteria bacterium RIFCSPLOWO2_02_FULL_55_14]|nr:MAG: hypothetical protein A2X68_11670 [Ignavibacteria bacterium GWC2_56_12]OGU68597.1 MAG: hypothetical protein A3C56_13215 [Ignavibacteria bacterium RIFCSPHIGHO2_02_FULL_56_12]OGU69007.1 MAG: hypothetical protein A3H45_15695 [Ignavibacteria bacterium RIFCSPLOWO2_02_FULL_55_14]OGU76157.1 MAG: hypothetical protein A3G43_06625 [Ignavibacteria bacterium RIFCSPLOWO2_12_FULL_56_21]HAV23665.1 hypothetical protein [Bacteroidota bacterium]
MNYRILITKTLDVPKNIFQEMYGSEEAAVAAAKQKLIDLNGDVAIVMQMVAGTAKVIHRFEQVRAAS